MELNRDEKWLLDEKFNGEKSEGFFTDCKRLKGGEPLGYIIGFVPFLDCKIFLDSKPLIPRSETEYWAEKAIKEIAGTATSSPCILDLCAGSGCIGVSIAKAVPESKVDFAEIETIHHKTILKNIIENQVDGSRCNIYSGNLFEKIATVKKYTHILSNPPYIDPALDRTERSVKTHEPHKALYGGKNGTELINRLITDSKSHLTHKGQLWIEHEPEQSNEISSLAKKNGFASTTHKDQYDVERYSILVLQ